MYLRPDNFAHTMVRAERRLLVYSMCVLCREGKLVSDIDGSLQEWEEGHQCRKKPAVFDSDAKSA
jgi:hypothetical protein